MESQIVRYGRWLLTRWFPSLGNGFRLTGFPIVVKGKTIYSVKKMTTAQMEAAARYLVDEGFVAPGMITLV